MAPASASMAVEISPVKAPLSAWCTFWPQTPTPLPASAAATSASAVAGGQTARSTPSAAARPARRSAHQATASARVLNIFQLPATRGRRLIG